jgi:hypothetical protein
MISVISWFSLFKLSEKEKVHINKREGIIKGKEGERKSEREGGRKRPVGTTSRPPGAKSRNRRNLNRPGDLRIIVQELFEIPSVAKEVPSRKGLREWRGGREGEGDRREGEGREGGSIPIL